MPGVGGDHRGVEAALPGRRTGTQFPDSWPWQPW